MKESTVKRLLVSTLLIISLSSFVFATAQDPDVLIIKGKTYVLYSNPLEKFYEKNLRPKFWIEPNTSSSGNWRGYVATWEIINQKLYLAKIDSWFCNKIIRTKSGCRRVTLQDLFGKRGTKGRVFANWFSEQLRVPDGKELEYVHMGYGSIYERDIIFDVESGKIVKSEVIDNTKQNRPSALELQRQELEKLKKSPIGKKP